MKADVKATNLRLFSSREKRDRFLKRWEKEQTKPVRYGAAGEYIGDTERLLIGGNEIISTPEHNGGFLKLTTNI